jgi:CheY-like chemotaxis protein
MKPHAFESAADALAWMATGRNVAAGIVDRSLRDADGLDLGPTLRKLEPRKLSLVLLDSVSIGAASATAAALAGYCAVVTKPFRPERLRDALATALQETTPKSRAPSSSARLPRADLPPLRVLLAEDNLVNQKVALAMLRRLGYRADVAESGVEAIAALEAETYDLVLMDVHMPAMDGLEATRRIRSRWSTERQPRIVAMTANAMEADQEACRDAGMDDFLAKPVRLESLAAALARCRPLSARAPLAEASAAQEPTAL